MQGATDDPAGSAWTFGSTTYSWISNPPAEDSSKSADSVKSLEKVGQASLLPELGVGLTEHACLITSSKLA